jgi:uncharacterized protein (TIGR02453 family)
MLQPLTLKFLKDLKKNNNKMWFDGHRKQYDTVKADFLSLVEQLIQGIASFDKPIGNLEAKNCTFRINRDVRFSKNKDPYKGNLAAYFNKDGKKGIGSGYYLHIEPGKTFAAGGIWMPEPTVLAGIRQEIDYSFTEWKKIVTDKSFRKIFPDGIKGDVLTRPPKGYDENNPAIEYLKMKSFIVSSPFTDADVQNKNFVKELTKAFRAMKPMIDFLNTSLD